MKQTFYINNEALEIDILKTQQFYIAQNEITDDCKCEECNFYVTNIITNPFEIFKMLEAMGVDLSKNLTGETTGVWCIRDDNRQFLSCVQVYQAIGEFANTRCSKLLYERTENNFIISTTVLKTEEGKVDFELQIDKV